MARPRIALSMLYLLGKPFREMLEQIPSAGTPSVELIDDGLHALDRKRVQTLSELAASYGLSYTVHAPFIGVNISSPSDWLLRAMMRGLKQSIVRASTLGARIWVFHPGSRSVMSNLYPGKDWIRNLRSSRQLFKFAEDHGVDATIENVPEPFPFVLKSVEDFGRFYSEIGEEIRLTLDIGHANINRQVEGFLKEFPDRIVHVHAHDNDGKSDGHLGIGFGTVDWEKTVAMMKKIGYSGTIVIESTEHVQESISKIRLLFS